MPNPTATPYRIKAEVELPDLANHKARATAMQRVLTEELTRLIKRIETDFSGCSIRSVECTGPDKYDRHAPYVQRLHYSYDIDGEGC